MRDVIVMHQCRLVRFLLADFHLVPLGRDIVLALEVNDHSAGTLFNITAHSITSRLVHAL